MSFGVAHESVLYTCGRRRFVKFVVVVLRKLRAAEFKPLCLTSCLRRLRSVAGSQTTHLVHDGHVEAGSLSLVQVHARDKTVEAMDTSAGLEGDIEVAQNVGE